MNLLTESQISAELATVPAWTRDGDSITTVTQRADFTLMNASALPELSA